MWRAGANLADTYVRQGVGERVVIVPWAEPFTSVQGTWALAWMGSAAGPGSEALETSTHAVNDAFTVPVLMSAGTWSATVVFVKGTDRPIFRLALDDGAGTFTDITADIDSYAGSATAKQVSTTAGIVVASSISRTLRCKVTSKNASSSDYWCAVQSITLVRTA